MAKYVGKVWIVGDDVDTDLIIAARYLNDPRRTFKEHCLEDVIPDFHNKQPRRHSRAEELWLWKSRNMRP